MKKLELEEAAKGFYEVNVYEETMTIASLQQKDLETYLDEFCESFENDRMAFMMADSNNYLSRFNPDAMNLQLNSVTLEDSRNEIAVKNIELGNEVKQG
mgnify:CR=1 FL=1